MTKRTSKTKSATTARAESKPTLPDYLQGPVTNYFGGVGALQNGAPPAAIGPTDTQQAGYSGARSLSSVSGPNKGLEGLLSLLGPAINYANGDLSTFEDPWNDRVTELALGDIERFRGMGINQGAANATQANAFGGSRHGVADSLTNEAALRTAASTAAGLRSAGFKNAQQQKLDAIASALGISTGAAGAWGADQANARANVGTQLAAGADERGIQQENDPAQMQAQWLAILKQILGVSGSDVMGNNVNSSGTSNSTTTEKGSTLDAIGKIMEAASAGAKLAYSDRRLKREIEPIGADAKGINWYSFAYLWDEPGTKRVGVMADEVPHAAVLDPDGFYRVDYGAL